MDGTTGNLEKLYNVSNTLIATKETIQKNKNSVAIETIDKTLNTLKVDFQFTTEANLGTDWYVNQFIELNNWADFNSNNSYQKGCSTNAKDYWTTNLDTCKNGYVKVSAGATANQDPSCLIFKEWSASQVTSRYSLIPGGCSTTTGSPDFTSVPAAINAYNSAFNTYSAQNTNLINQLESETAKLNGGFVSMSNKLLDLLNNVDGIILPLVKIFNQYVGNGGIFDLVNCGNK